MVPSAPLDPALLDQLTAAFSLRGQPPKQGLDPFERAFGESPRVERWGWDDHKDQVVEVIEGRAAVRAWLSLAPVGTRFTVADAAADSRSGLPAIRYAVAVHSFSNQGSWEIGVGPDARVAVLVHRPDTLPPPDLASLQPVVRGE
jgi:hypothetical protein